MKKCSPNCKVKRHQRLTMTYLNLIRSSILAIWTELRRIVSLAHSWFLSRGPLEANQDNYWRLWATEVTKGRSTYHQVSRTSLIFRTVVFTRTLKAAKHIACLRKREIGQTRRLQLILAPNQFLSRLKLQMWHLRSKSTCWKTNVCFIVYLK